MLFRLCFAAALIASLAPGQTPRTAVFPAGSKGVVDRNYDWILGAAQTNMPVHAQYGYATSELPVPVMQVKQLAWRRNNFYSNRVNASTQTLLIHMSTGAKAPASFTTTYAANEGKDRAQVFKGNVSWPAAVKASGPAPFILKVPLAKTFILIKTRGKSFVVDIRVTARNHQDNGRQVFIIVDADAPAFGTRTTNGSQGIPRNCKNSLGQYNNSIGYTTGGLTDAGGPWYVRYGRCLPNAPGVTMISAYGSGMKFGSITLPINLAGLGAPNCFFNTGTELSWIPWVADAQGQGRVPNLQIPPGLGGAAFYDQGMYVDIKANAFHWVMCWSSKWTIVKSRTPNAVTVYRTRDSQSLPTGTLRKSAAAVTEVTY